MLPDVGLQQTKTKWQMKAVEVDSYGPLFAVLLGSSFLQWLTFVFSSRRGIDQGIFRLCKSVSCF